MKKLFLFYCTLPFLSILFTACEEDIYSPNDYEIMMATVSNPNNGAYFYLYLDNGDVLWITETDKQNYKPRTGERIIVNYTILDDESEWGDYDYTIKLNDAYSILSKIILNVNASTEGSIGNDPVGIKEMWIGDDFLNVLFYYKGGDETHAINLIRDISKDYSDNKIHLEFRHNNRNDQGSQTMPGIASFDLSILQAETTYQAVDIVVHVNKFDNSNAVYNLTYNFSNQNMANKELTLDIFNESKNMASID